MRRSALSELIGALRRLLVFSICALPATAAAERNLGVAPTEQRVALVIGNAAYTGSPLRNPVNDARAIAARLQRLGFVVIKRENLKAKEIGPALREFRSRLSAGATALFFYAGHGLQVKGVNYLPTVDAEIDAEEDVPTQALDVGKVLELMEESKTKINLVFLDACRNNPFARKFRSASRGLAKVDAASGTLISFATRPGSVAADGEGKNGLYTEYLLRHMEEPGVPIEQMLKRVGAGVKLASKGQQEPWSEGLIEGDFFFRTEAQLASAPAAAQTSSPAPVRIQSAAEVEQELWDAIKDSHDANDFREYLSSYPSGRFAAVARTRLRTFTAAPEQTTAPAQQVALAAPSSAISLASAGPGSVFRDCNDCPEMVVIPPGSYAMDRTRQITINYKLAVGKTEVTFAQWDACAADGGCGGYRPDDRSWGRGSQPVMNVSWDDTRQYVAWLSRKTGKSYRLLTEAEWEYAARAGTTTTYYWGDSDADICQYASVSLGRRGHACGPGRPGPVGGRRPNPFGLHDMLGSMWEWVEDCWNRGISTVPSDGSARTSGDCASHVLRGGSWFDDASDARSASRAYNGPPSYRNIAYGLRVARD